VAAVAGGRTAASIVDDPGAGHLGDKLPCLPRIADLVLAALQRDPWVAKVRRGAVDESDLRARVVLEALAAAQRLVPFEIRAKAQGQGPLERADRGLGQCRVYDCGARRIADENRVFVALHAVFLLREMRERLEGCRGVDAGIGRGQQSLAHLVDVDAEHEGALVDQVLRHVDDSQVPAPVAGHEDHELLRRPARLVDRDAAEPRIRDGIGRMSRQGYDRQYAS